MKRTVVVVLWIGLAGFASLAGAAEEKLAASRIASVGLFKNGLAVVQRTLTVGGPGVYRVEDVPEPIHGTFWVESDARITTRLNRRVVEVPARQAGGGNFQEELAGREVVIHFNEQGIPPVSGTVMEMDRPRGKDAWNRAYQQPNYGYDPFYSSFGSNPQPSAARMLVLTNETGRCYVDPAKIAYLQAKGAGQTVKRRKPVMLFTVADMKEKTATISISYLAKGMAWAPSYRVDISDPKTLMLRQEAVIKNELESIEGARISLISGFPNVQFANVTSPLSLGTTWSSFFQQLNQRYAPGHSSMSNTVSQQAVSYNPAGDTDLSATPAGEGVDLHYQDIGPQTLDEGDSLALETASGKAAYQRIVEWIVPDTRRANGQFIQEYERQNDPEKYQDAVLGRRPVPQSAEIPHDDRPGDGRPRRPLQRSATELLGQFRRRDHAARDPRLEHPHAKHGDRSQGRPRDRLGRSAAVPRNDRPGRTAGEQPPQGADHAGDPPPLLGRTGLGRPIAQADVVGRGRLLDQPAQRASLDPHPQAGRRNQAHLYLHGPGSLLIRQPRVFA